MKKYKVWFRGREVGAISIFSNFCIIVEAEDEEKARLKVYDTHEHLSCVRIEEVK